MNHLLTCISKTCIFLVVYALPIYFIFKCLACQKRYTGQNCDVACPYPSYGLDCQTICNCAKLFCDHVNGCRNPTEVSFQNICHGYVVGFFFTINIL